jgi:hypothetical protein
MKSALSLTLIVCLLASAVPVGAQETTETLVSFGTLGPGFAAVPHSDATQVDWSRAGKPGAVPSGPLTPLAAGDLTSRQLVMIGQLQRTKLKPASGSKGIIVTVLVSAAVLITVLIAIRRSTGVIVLRSRTAPAQADQREAATRH